MKRGWIPSLQSPGWNVGSRGGGTGRRNKMKKKKGGVGGEEKLYFCKKGKRPRGEFLLGILELEKKKSQKTKKKKKKKERNNFGR
jgi:hypothetical protein